MQPTTPNLTAQDKLHRAFKQEWDTDFIRAKFNLSSREVEIAIKNAGTSPEKLVEYLRNIFSRK